MTPAQGVCQTGPLATDPHLRGRAAHDGAAAVESLAHLLVRAVADQLATASGPVPLPGTGSPTPGSRPADEDPARPALTVAEAAAALGISRALAYELVRRGEVPSVRLGRRIVVPRVALGRLLEGSGGR